MPTHSRCFRFEISYTLNKYLPEDLKPKANLVIWKVKSLACGSYQLSGFVQFNTYHELSTLTPLSTYCVYSATDVQDCITNFHPLTGGYVISWGSLDQTHMFDKPPVSCAIRRKSPVAKASRHAAGPYQHKIDSATSDSNYRSLTQLAASEMGLNCLEITYDSSKKK